MKKLGRIFMTGYLAVCMVFLFSFSSFAYIDPSVTTYAVQAIAGVAIAVGAFAAVYLRKAKKKVNEKLGIDENAKKEVEGEIEEITPDTNAEDNANPSLKP